MAFTDFYHKIDLHNNTLSSFKSHPISTLDRVAFGLTLGLQDEGMFVFDIDNDLYYFWDGVQWITPGISTGVTSVDLTMPSAFNVTGNPITTSGTFNVTGAGTINDYIRGDGTLAVFPTFVDTNFANTDLTQTATRTYLGGGYNYTLDNLGEWSFTLANNKDIYFNNVKTFNILSEGYGNSLTYSNNYTTITNSSGAASTGISTTNTTGVQSRIFLQAQSTTFDGAEILLDSSTSGGIFLTHNSGNIRIGNLTNLSTQNRIIGQVDTGGGQIGYLTLGTGVTIDAGVLNVATSPDTNFAITNLTQNANRTYDGGGFNYSLTNLGRWDLDATGNFFGINGIQILTQVNNGTTVGWIDNNGDYIDHYQALGGRSTQIFQRTGITDTQIYLEAIEPGQGVNKITLSSGSAALGTGELQGITINPLSGNLFITTVNNDDTEDKLLTWNSTDKKVEYRTLASITSLDTNFANTNLTQTAARTYAGAGFNYTLNNLGNWAFNMATGKNFEVYNSNSVYLETLNASSSGQINLTPTGFSLYNASPSSGQAGITATTSTANSTLLHSVSGSGYSEIYLRSQAATQGIFISPYLGKLHFTNLTNLTTQNRILGQFGTSGQVGHLTLGSGVTIDSGVLNVATSPDTHFGNTNLTATGNRTHTFGANTSEITYNSLAGNTGFLISASSTLASSGAQILADFVLSGTNVNSSQATYALRGSNNHTGTGSTNNGIMGIVTGGVSNYAIRGQAIGAGATTNVAGYFVAQNASGTNGAIIVPANSGNVGIGTSTPTLGTILDVVDNSLAGTSMVKLSSTSTLAASNLQRVLDISLSGANDNANQTTYAGYFSNTHTGTGTTLNVGLYGTASGGVLNRGVMGDSAWGVYGIGTITGVYGTTSSGSGSGVGAYNTASSGTGAALVASSTIGRAAQFSTNAASTNSVQTILELSRSTSGGVGANGIGVSFDFNIATSASGSSLTLANRIISRWSNADVLSLTSEYLITGKTAGTNEDWLTIIGGRTRLNKYGVNTFAATPAYAAGWDASGNFVEFAVPTGISSLTADNGLTKNTSTNVQLGGTLLQNTTIAGGAFGLILTGTSPTVSSLNVSNNSIGTGSIINISSTSTSATGGTQSLIRGLLTGVHSNSSVTTSGINIVNSHSGTSSTNIGGTFEASGGTTNHGIIATGTNTGVSGTATTGSGGYFTSSTGEGVVGISTNGLGAYGSSNTGIGVYGQSQNNYGLQAQSLTTYAINAQVYYANTNSVLGVLALRRYTQGTAANGIGGRLDFITHSISDQDSLSNQLISKWVDAITASRTSQFIITGVNNAVTADLFTLSGNGQTRNNKYGVGTFVSGTPAYNAAWDASGNLMETPFGAVAAHTHPASEVFVTELGSATYDELQELHNLTRSAGHLDGGEITDITGENVSVAAGQGFIRATSDDTSTLFAFDWGLTTPLAIPTNTIRYIQVEYNAGSPIVTLSAAETYDYRTSFPLGFVVNEGGLLYINETPHNVGRIAGRLSRRNYETDGRTRATELGGLIISETGTKKIKVSAGVTWFRGLRDATAGIDTNIADTLDRYYRDGVGGYTIEFAQTDLPLNTYDDGTGSLATVTNNRYANYWIYYGPSGKYTLVYGRTNSTSLANAQLEAPPSGLPLRLQVGSLLLGRFITLRSGAASSVALVESAFNSIFSGASVSDHNDLGGLNVGDYLHLTAAEYSNVFDNFSNTDLTLTAYRTHDGAGYGMDLINLSNFEIYGIDANNYLKFEGNFLSGKAVSGTYLTTFDYSHSSLNWYTENSATSNSTYFNGGDNGSEFGAFNASGAYANWYFNSSVNEFVLNSKNLKINKDGTGNLFINNLTNLATQNRIIGQYDTDNQIGYLTLGSGVTIDAGVLNVATGSDTNFANTNLTQTANRIYEGGDFTYTFNNLNKLQYNFATGVNNKFEVRNAREVYLESQVVPGNTEYSYLTLGGGYHEFFGRKSNSTYYTSFDVNATLSRMEYIVKASGQATSEILMTSHATTGGITLKPQLGVLKVTGLLNLSTQDRIVGQFGTSNQIGFITIGSGLSLAAGVLSASGGSGETNTISSLGGGLDIQAGKSGVDLRVNTLNANDFDVAANLISIDYVNGQAASGSTKGFLTAADWTTFNNKGNVFKVGTPVTNRVGYWTGDGTLGHDANFLWTGTNFSLNSTTNAAVLIDFIRSSTVSNSGGNYLLSSINTIALDGTALTGNKFIGNSVFNQSLALNANQTIPNSTDVAGSYSLLNITNSSAFTLTSTQSASIRAISAVKSVVAFTSFNVGSVITHLANFHIQSIQAPSISGTVSNYYGLLFEDQTANATLLTTTNKWAIYQAGANDRNYFNGNSGFGIAAPLYKLDVAGTFRFADGTQALNRVLTSDANGVATWQTPAGGSGDMILASAQTNSGAKTFLDTTFLLRNVANTFNGSFVNTNTANRIYTLKDANGTLAFTTDITGTNSGTNTGDQTITLTGGVTGSGTGSFAATVITNANLTGIVTSVGNATAIADGAIAPAKLTAGSSAQLLIGAVTTGIPTYRTVTGDVTIDNLGVTTIGPVKVTNAMLAGSIDLTTKVTGILPGTNGGTGVNNSTRTITIAGNLTTTGAFNTTFAVTGSNTITFPNAAITVARIDAAQTFTGVQTFSSTIVGSINGNAATVTTIPTLSGEVTNSGNAITLVNASVIGKVLTGYVSGAGTVAATDTILQAINKLNGNTALKFDTSAFTDAAVTSKLITGYVSGAGTVAASDTILQAIQKLNGNDALRVTSVTGTTNKITSTGGTTPVINIGTDVVDKTISNTYTAGAKQNFLGNATNAAINFGGISSDPSSLVNGDIWFNTTSNQFKARINAATRILVNTDESQTLTNKSVNGVTLVSGGSLTLFLNQLGTYTAAGSSSPLTTKGDIYTFSTVNDRLPVGTNGQVLSSDSTVATGLKWIALAGGGDMVLAANQTVTGLKTFDPSTLAMKGSSTGVTTIANANASVTNYTQTLPAKTGTFAMTSDITGGMTWTEVTGTTQGMAVDNAYIANNASQVVFTLPATAAVGKIVAVVGKGAGGWRIAQNASGKIHFGFTDSLTGTGGYIESSRTYDSVELVCIVANNEWVVRSSVGNITVNIS